MQECCLLDVPRPARPGQLGAHLGAEAGQGEPAAIEGEMLIYCEYLNVFLKLFYFCLPLKVVFCLVPKFLGATLRHYDFMLRGLKEVRSEAVTFFYPSANRIRIRSI